MIWFLLCLLFLASIVGGGFGYRHYGFAGLSPIGVVLIVVVVLYFTGSLT